jgi:UDP-N-acetylmuramoylalanine--D-glutamate ligase
MQPLELKGKRVLVVGMARSGMAAAFFLKARGARVTVSEMRPAEALRTEIPRLLESGVTIETGGHRERTFLDADFILVSPGVPAGLPLLERARVQHIPVYGEVDFASRFLRGEIVAVTGSNGKTTTTALIAHLLEACGRHVQIGGNIGTPLISLVESSTDTTVNVIEVSSFQLETTQVFHPRVAVVLNLTPDHLDRHGSMEAYAAAKQRIFANQAAGDSAVLNAADIWCRRYARLLMEEPPKGGSRGRIVWFGLDHARALAELKSDGLTAAGDDGAWLTTAPMAAAAELRAQSRGNGADRHAHEGPVTTPAGAIAWQSLGVRAPILDVADIPLRGSHNIENVLASVAVACIVAGPEKAPAIREAVRTFKAVEHRLEFVARIGGVDYFNDSKATNVDATEKALQAFPSGVWLILGGKDKGSDYTLLAPLLRGRTRGVLLIGAATEKIASQLQPLGIELTRAGTLERAVEIAASRARSGDTVLLAPACASFDQFDNYEHRGRVFKQLVAELTRARFDSGTAGSGK